MSPTTAVMFFNSFWTKVKLLFRLISFVLVFFSYTGPVFALCIAVFEHIL